MTFNKRPLTPHEKQEIWRQKQLRIFYGSGRPIYQLNIHNQQMRRYYDSNMYYSLLTSKPLLNIHHEHFSRTFYKTFQ